MGRYRKPRARRPLRDRLMEKVYYDPMTGCWLFTGAQTGGGYGAIGSGGKGQAMLLAHRASYELHVGPIPDGAVVRHRCDTKPCVNPQHLAVGTTADNVHDKMRRGRWRGNQILTERQIRTIQSSGELGVDLAKRFGVSNATISYWRARA